LKTQTSSVIISRLETAPYGTNAYLVSCPRSNNCVLVDAPGEGERIRRELKNLRLQSIVLTHSHFDHTGALQELADRFQVPVAAHAADADRLPRRPDIHLKDNEVLTFGEIELMVLYTPGHTPGSLCFWSEGILLSGDTLFPGGPGRTASPAAFQQILNSLNTKIFVLPDSTTIYPGHGPSTTLKKEKQKFAVFTGRPHAPELCGDVLWLSS
jgi:hydroxyacylglutathione hydrolase